MVLRYAYVDPNDLAAAVERVAQDLAQTAHSNI